MLLVAPLQFAVTVPPTVVDVGDAVTDTAAIPSWTAINERHPENNALNRNGIHIFRKNLNLPESTLLIFPPDR